MEWFDRPELSVICYTAGLLDGEGTIDWQKNGNRFSARIFQSERNRGRQLCQWLQQEWGLGRIYSRQLQYSGPLYSMWNWRVCRAREVEHLLVCLLPYLRVKREDGMAAILHLQRHLAQGRRFAWTQREDEYLLSHWIESDLAIGTALGRGQEGVRKRRRAFAHWSDRRGEALRRDRSHR